MIKTHFCNKALLLAQFFFLFCCLSCNSNPTDAEVENDIQKKLASMQGYEAVQVAVRDNIVFLTGQCEGEGCAQQLEKRIREVDGVVAVENDITEGKPPGR